MDTQFLSPLRLLFIATPPFSRIRRARRAASAAHTLPSSSSPFLRARPIPPRRPPCLPPQSSQSPSAPSPPVASPTRLPSAMRRSPPPPRRGGSRDDVTTVTSVEALVSRGAQWWRRAAGPERAAAAALAVTAVSVSALAINVVVHVSFALAFFAVPLVLAPFVFTLLAASVTAFSMLAFATAGAGFFFVGTPFLAFTLLTKAFLPLVIVSAVVANVVRNVLRKTAGAPEATNAPSAVVDEEGKQAEEGGDAMKATRDELEDFDRVLRRRGRGGGSGGDAGAVGSPRAWDVAAWSLSDVVDELDATGLAEYRQLFIDERIDGRTLLALSDDDIRSEFAAMPLGDRMRLSRLIADLRRRSKP